MPSSTPTRKSPLSRLRAVTASEWRDLLRALAAVVRARVHVRTRPRGRLMATTDEGATPLELIPLVRQRATALAWAVDRVADLPGIGATCLVRALALQHLLHDEGIRDGRLHVGVNRDGGRLEAHAWVELGAIALGAPGRDRHRFTPMSVLAGRPPWRA